MDLGGLVGGAIGIAAPIIANAAGVGKNDTRARTFNESDQYDPHAFQYGGRQNGANEAAGLYQTNASRAQFRGAAQAGLVGTNYGSANAWEQGNAADRSQQGTVARMMMARAQGLVPSIASQQAALDMQRATAAQSSAAASARGAGGLALAGQNAANNTATMQSAISNQAQINSANERMQAEQGAFGAYSGMRAGDAQAQQQAAQQAQYAAQLHAQQNQYNAGLTQQQHQLNDVYSMGNYGLAQNVRQLQMQGGIAQQNMLSGSQNSATGLNAQISQNNANREFDYYKQATGSAMGGASAALTPGAAPNVPQPNVGVSAPTGGMAMGQTSGNMVGIPQPGPTGSDDRMKMGVSPLGLLGVWGGGGHGMNPSSGPAASSYESLSGGGENVAASGQAMNANAMRFQNDPTSYGDGPGESGGMMNGGLLSDDRAKRAAYMLGRQDGAQQARAGEDVPYSVGNPLTDEEELFVGKGGPEIRPTEAARERGLMQWVDAGTKARAAAQQNGGLDRDAAYFSPPAKAQPRPSMDRDEAYFAPGRSGDPITDQFASGLAPIRFQYRPGMGPGGEQTGVRAQAAASQPVTASMVTKRPDGLLQLDPAMGLGTALAGVGHLAKKQQDNEAKLNGLLAMAARREGY